MPLELPATFVSDVNVPVGAADMNNLRDVAILLDGLTYRRVNVCNSSGPQTTGDAADWHSKGDYRQSWWGLYYRSGMTTLTIEGSCANQLDFYINGTFNSSQAAATPFTKNITISGTDGDVILLEVKTNGNPNPSTGTSGYTPKYIIYDVYAGPITVASSWPGVPTFAGTYSAALLNQLRDAAQYIWDHVTAVPLLPNIAQTYIASTHKAETLKMFHGSVGRYHSNDILRVIGTLNCRVNAEHYVILLGGATSVTSSTYTAGQNITFSHPIVLTHTLGTRAEVEIRAVNEDNTYANTPGVFSSYSFVVMRSEADSSGYASASPPTAFTAEESISDTTLNSRMNSIGTMLSNAKGRLDARPELWNRARAFRRVYAKDDTQVSRNMKRHGAIFQRQGDTLIVRGKGVKIGYGAITFKPPAKEGDPINYSDFTFAVEQSVGTTEDKIQTNTVPLDSIPGLQPSMLYYVWAPVLEYAGEFIS